MICYICDEPCTCTLSAGKYEVKHAYPGAQAYYKLAVPLCQKCMTEYVKRTPERFTFSPDFP